MVIDKRLHIMEAAVQCFATKGYHATSIQEIADAAGMAKSSLYFYFKSKEELLLFACKHFHDVMMNKLLSVNKENLSPRERFSKQIQLLFKQMSDSRHFLTTLIHEQKIEISSSVKAFFFEIRAVSLYWYYTRIIEIYGETTRPYAIDAAAMLNGMISEYFAYVFFDQKELDLNAISDFLIDRLDDIMSGMMRQKQSPILSEQNMQALMAKGKERYDQTSFAVLEQIREMRSRMDDSDLESDLKEELSASLLALEEEFTRAQPRSIVMKSIIAYLRSHYPMNELEAQLIRLEAHIHS